MVWQIDLDTFGETKDIQAKTITDPNTNTQKPFEFNLRFAGQYYDDETGYHYNYHRYYDPSLGRYLTSDPIGLAGGLNSYGYANGKPWEGVDVLGLYSVSKNGWTTFYTEDFPLLKEFKIPTPKGWVDYSTRDEYFHKYNMSVAVNDLNSKEKDALQRYLINHPTPNSKAKPATPNGVYNPASPDFGPFAGAAKLSGTIPDDVQTYLFEGKNGGKFLVNVTHSNHSLKYGIVIRGLEFVGGKTIMHNYGEGNGRLQSYGCLSNFLINDIWYWASEYALEQVTSRKYSVNGKDWTSSNPIPVMP